MNDPFVELGEVSPRPDQLRDDDAIFDATEVPARRSIWA
jgi:hypothetical protein